MICKTEKRQDYRNAMARLGAAVNIVTTDGISGRAGFTASAVCSITDSPPTLLVCLNRSASVYDHFKYNKQLCVNTLSSKQESLSSLFGGKTPMEERFSSAEWTTSITSSPILVGAIASFDCEIVKVISVSTHDVLVCEAKSIFYDVEGDGLIYFDRGYQYTDCKGQRKQS
jgi:flavin reductase